MANNGIYLHTANNRGAATHLKDCLPNGIRVDEQIFGGKHQTIDGGRAFDFVAVKLNINISWSNMSAAEYTALRTLVVGGTTLYLWLPDSSSTVYTVLCRSGIGKTFHYRPDGTIVYDAVTVLFEEA